MPNSPDFMREVGKLGGRPKKAKSDYQQFKSNIDTIHSHRVAGYGIQRVRDPVATNPRTIKPNYIGPTAF